jgi:hypothetical protein
MLGIVSGGLLSHARQDKKTTEDPEGAENPEPAKRKPHNFAVARNCGGWRTFVVCSKL